MNDIITDLRDMRYLSWSKTRRSSGTAGSFLKSYDETGIKKKYYKLSDFDTVWGIVGHECVNEIIVQRLLRLLGLPHLEYTLVHALVCVDDKEYETYLCESEDYKLPGETKLSLEDYYAMEKKAGEDPFSFCLRKGWADQIYGMLLIDYIVLNRDRHGANIEVLRSNRSRSERLAPLFDHGLSLVCRCHTVKDLEHFDVMEDKRVQSFIGSGSTLENLKLIPGSYLTGLPKPDETGLAGLFKGLDQILEPAFITTISHMIRERWCSLDRI